MHRGVKLSAVALISGFALPSLVGSAITSWTAALASGAADALQVKTPAKLTYSQGKNPGTVTFDHKAHETRAEKTARGCVSCHHTSTNAKLKTESPAKCSSCHLARGQAKNPKVKGKELWTREAFHANCTDCHKQAKAGPTKCTECHVKK